MRRCTRCGVEKQPTDFYISRTNGSLPGSRRSRCKECEKQASSASIKAWRLKNPDKFRDARLKKLFGISLAEYERKNAEQLGVCSICKQPDPAFRRLAVDHDHNTGAVRDLLCSRCNQGLGLFADSVERLDVAAGYVLRHSKSAFALPESERAFIAHMMNPYQ